MRTLPMMTAAALFAAVPALAATDDGAEILYSPIGGIENSHWFDYRTDILEAQQELDSDLADAGDQDDVFSARAEYRREVADALYDYQKEAVEAGLPIGRVYVGD